MIVCLGIEEENLRGMISPASLSVARRFLLNSMIGV